MKIQFQDTRLALIRTDRAFETKLPFGIIKSCRDKLVILEAAPDERTLRNWKSLRYEKLKGDREGQRSIRINDQYRMIFTLDESQAPPILNILEVRDYHD
ncbi:MAG: type II toxin-antitoxin system RelE/ParE family toxin [Nitrospira sp.]|jgi:proteic killer suppression protein